MVASGNRTGHMSYDGENVLYTSRDGGKTWSAQSVINAQAGIDFRDAGILYLGNDQFLLNYFVAYESGGTRVTANSYVRQGTLSNGVITWGDAIQVPLQSPHGPTQLSNGTLFWVGDAYYDPSEGYDKNNDGKNDYTRGNDYAMKSTDGGKTWSFVAHMPNIPNYGAQGCEFHTTQLSSGRLVTTIRLSVNSQLQTYVSTSDDQGVTWTTPVLVTKGAPAHLLAHPSGILVMTYGFRGDTATGETKYGIRARLSYDGGDTWGEEILLDSTAATDDCGYPCSVEAKDGSLYTVYYKTNASSSAPGIWGVSWTLPTQMPTE